MLLCSWFLGRLCPVQELIAQRWHQRDTLHALCAPRECFSDRVLRTEYRYNLEVTLLQHFELPYIAVVKLVLGREIPQRFTVSVTPKAATFEEDPQWSNGMDNGKEFSLPNIELLLANIESLEDKMQQVAPFCRPSPALLQVRTHWQHLKL